MSIRATFVKRAGLPALAALGVLSAGLPASSQSWERVEENLDIEAKGVVEARLNDGVEDSIVGATALRVRLDDVLGGTIRTEIAANATFELEGGGFDEEDIRLNEGFYSRNIGDWTASIGRKKARWGVGYVSSPTDIVSASNSPFDPDDRFFQIEGRDIVQATYIGESGSFDFLALREKDGASALEEHALAFRIYQNIDGVDLALVGGVEPETKAFVVGGNAAFTIGSALELHGDVLFDSDAPARDVRIGPGGQVSIARSASFRALVGGQWTSPGDVNFVLEYLYFSEGFSNDAVRTLAATNILANLQTGAGASAGSIPLQTHYLFGRVAKDDVIENVDAEWVVLKTLHNAGVFHRLRLSREVTDNAIAYLEFFDVSGPAGTEFGESLVEGSIRLGVELTF